VGRLPSTSLAQFHDSFQALEDELDVFSLTIEGLPVWERIRLPIAVSLKQQTGVYDARKDSTPKGESRYAAALRLLLKNLFYRNPFLASQHDVLVWGHQRRKEHANNYWWDVYCDPIYEELDVDYVHFEIDHRFTHKTPARTERLRYLDAVKYGGALLKKLGRGSVLLDRDSARKLTEIERAIENRFGVSVDVSGRALSTLELERATEGLYDRLLRNVDPTVALIVVAYGKEGFVDACRRHDVPVVELQHGVINEFHYGYDFPENRPKRSFPDYVFTFGPFWKEGANYPIPDDRVIPVGYPYLEWQREAIAPVKERDRVLFISSGYSVGTQLSQIAVETAESIGSEVVYKLHPNEFGDWERQYPWLAESTVQVIDTDTPSLYELFASSRQQVGVASTALYEGITFGLPTFVAELAGAEYLTGAIESGHARLVSSADELTSEIDTWTPDPEIESQRFFCDSPLERFESALETASRRPQPTI
jgi:hypothetical protein